MVPRNRRRGDWLRNLLWALATLVSSSGAVAVTDTLWANAAEAERTWWSAYVHGVERRCK